MEGIIRAFEQDLHLVLRPDDIWLGILIQFGSYVQGHAEELQHLFVEHREKKELVIDVRPYSVFDFNIGTLAQQMTTLIQDNVVDPGLRNLIMPSFTTTTDNDRSVAAMIMMATLQDYFTYSIKFGCGFPSVTLEGEVSDWKDILSRIQKLSEYGNEVAEWVQLLIPVLRHFIDSFQHPNSEETKYFWLHAAKPAGQNGSMDTETISGWLTAFCFWDKHGKRICTYSKDADSRAQTKDSDRMPLRLDGVLFPIIRRKSIPAAIMKVPVLLDDEGSGERYMTTLMAGSVGMNVVVKEESDDSDVKGVCASIVSPRSGWWMLKDEKKDKDAITVIRWSGPALMF